MDDAADKPIKFLSIEAVMERTGRTSRVTIYADVKRGLLPPFRKYGGRTVFIESEVSEYMRRIVDARERAPA